MNDIVLPEAHALFKPEEAWVSHQFKGLGAEQGHKGFVVGSKDEAVTALGEVASLFEGPGNGQRLPFDEGVPGLRAVVES